MVWILSPADEAQEAPEPAKKVTSPTPVNTEVDETLS